MKTSMHILTLTAAVAVAAVAPHSSAAQEFSADVVQTPAHGSENTKLFVGNSKIRFENYENGQPVGGAIWDFGTQALTLVMDREKEYIGGTNNALVSKMMAQSGAPPIWRLFHPTSTSDPCTTWNSVVQAYAVHDTSARASFSCQSLGTGVVNGRAAQKWSVVSTDRTGKKQTGMVWIDSRLHVVSQTQDNTGSMQLANIQEGAQPASVFAIPASYHQLDMRQMMASMHLNGDSIAAALANAAKSVGDSVASNTASSAKTQATTSVTKKLKGILRLP